MTEPIPDHDLRAPANPDAWVGEQWRHICEQTPTCMAVFDREIRYLAASEAWIQAYEAGCGEVRGQDFYARHPNAPERWREANRRALAGETIRNDHEHRVLEDGSEVWSRWICTPWHHPDGSIGGIAVTTENLTPLELAQRRLNIAEQELHLALDAARAGTWEVDLRTYANKWSPETWRLYGLDPGQVEASAEAWGRTMVAEHRETVYRSTMEAVERREEIETEWRVDIPGEERWLFARGRPVTEHDGRMERYIGVVIDVTARKKAEQAAADQEHELRTVLDALPVGVAHVAPDLRYRYANRRYGAYFGRRRDEIPGLSVPHVIGDEVAERAMPHIREVLAGRPQSFESRVAMPDGQDRHFQVDLVPELDVDGQVLGYFAISVDKTAQVRIDAELGRTRDRLEQFTRRQVAQQTVMAVAHELRQPLHAAANFIEAVPLMLAQAKPVDEIVRVVGRVGDEIRRANRALTQLFDFVRDDGTLPPGRHLQLTLNEVVGSALAHFRSDHGAALSCARLDLCADPGHLACDPIMVERIITNLLRNATEAIACGTTCMPGAWILLRTCRVDGKVRLSVEDNGGGVAALVRPHLFQPFRSTKPSGLGLGLSICRQLLELHGGCIWHEDRPGGSAFCVDLPVAP